MDLKKNALQISIKLIKSLLIVLFVSVISARTEGENLCFRNDKRINKLVRLLDNYLSRDSIQVTDGIVIKNYKNQIIRSSDSYVNKNSSSNANSENNLNHNEFVFPIANRSNSVSENQCSDWDDYVFQKLGDFISEKVIDIRIPLILNRSVSAVKGSFQFNSPRVFGKNPFMTGFGLGFLAFGLKKLLLPLFIGAQIVKSILIAMFLPSILGSVGKLVGKGVSTFASSSGSSGLGHGGGGGGGEISDFDFKDTGGSAAGSGTSNNYGDSESAGSESGYNGVWTFPDKGPIYRNPVASAYSPLAPLTSGYGASQPNPNNYIIAADLSPSKSTSSKYSSKYTTDLNRTKFGISESFYTKDKEQDYKVFQNIPSSSQLLANYDPFYSPLLSRIDAVFKTLGYSVEPCRERLVCFMYKNPAKYAPYSNLISAQLSRELNELRKPSTDNPEILRFFRYMKAAKDGQDGVECELIYPGCTVPRAPNDKPPMVATFNDINKLVHARQLKYHPEKT